MKRIKLYLETTIPNYIFADDTPRERDITKDFMKMVKEGRYDAYISKLVIDEIERTKDIQKKKNLLEAIAGIESLSFTDKSEELGNIYVARKVIPKRYFPDAIHIAIATLNRLDVLVTWNMDHLANPRTRIRIREINEEKGYKVVDISTPEEVIACE